MSRLVIQNDDARNTASEVLLVGRQHPFNHSLAIVDLVCVEAIAIALIKDTNMLSDLLLGELLVITNTFHLLQVEVGPDETLQTWEVLEHLSQDLSESMLFRSGTEVGWSICSANLHLGDIHECVLAQGLEEVVIAAWVLLSIPEQELEVKDDLVGVEILYQVLSNDFTTPLCGYSLPARSLSPGISELVNITTGRSLGIPPAVICARTLSGT